MKCPVVGRLSVEIWVEEELGGIVGWVPCRALTMPFFSRPRHSAAFDRRPMGDVTAISFFQLPHGVPGSCYQRHTILRCRWPVWNETFVIDEEKLIIVAQGHECLYNWQHKDYNNNLVKDNCWKDIAGEVHAQGKEQATQYFVHYRKAYCWCAFVWYYSDNVTALFILVEGCKSTWARPCSYWPNIFKVLSVVLPYTHGFFTSTSTETAKCCDIRELWQSVCVFNHTVFHIDIIS